MLLNVGLIIAFFKIIVLPYMYLYLTCYLVSYRFQLYANGIICILLRPEFSSIIFHQFMSVDVGVYSHFITMIFHTFISCYILGIINSMNALKKNPI